MNEVLLVDFSQLSQHRFASLVRAISYTIHGKRHIPVEV